MNGRTVFIGPLHSVPRSIAPFTKKFLNLFGQFKKTLTTTGNSQLLVANGLILGGKMFNSLLCCIELNEPSSTECRARWRTKMAWQALG